MFENKNILRKFNTSRPGACITLMIMTINYFLTLIPNGYCLVHTNIIKDAIDSKDWKDSFHFTAPILVKFVFVALFSFGLAAGWPKCHF